MRDGLPHLVDGTLPGWRRRLLQRHLARCAACTDELRRQRTVAEGLRELGEGPPIPQPDPPDEVLDVILDRVRDPGLRERVAAPARGAVSGARPELSVSALLLSLLVTYLVWRAARRLVDRFDGSGW
ncbi:MAG TPA: zf-HC2 domain-containing protein [Nitriliruptorales bacterium]|nr:zf-HC2 domain-containing protein [Nitriliruptorales bacterium]